MAETASRRKVRYRLYDAQDDFVWSPAKYSLFLGGVGAGKTVAGAVKAIPHIRRPGTFGLVIAPTFSVLRPSTWRTALEYWRPLDPSAQILRGEEMKVIFANGSEVLFRSAEDPERLRGPNADWAWIDEGALCHPDTWPIVIGRLRSRGEAGSCWVTSTPKGMNWLYETFVVRATPETALYKGSTRANPFVAREYVESLESQYEGDFARQELEAEFIEDIAGALLRYEWIEAAASREGDYESDAPIFAGVDVAGPGEGGDETVLCVRKGHTVLELRAWRGGEVRGEVLAALRRWRDLDLRRVNVDVGGVGMYFAEHLRDDLKGVTVSPVNFGAAPTSPRAAERYENLKAEIYWALRERFERGEIDGLLDRATRTQLAGLRYELNGRGKVQIESKERIRKQGGKSPDRAEALMLAFWTSPRVALAEIVGRASRVRVG